MRLTTLVQRFGWRAYALPILTVVTVASMVSPSGRADRWPTAPSAGVTDAVEVPTPLAASQQTGEVQPTTESPAPSLAAPQPLPASQSYIDQGTADFQVLAGASAPVGSGPVVRYQVTVEGGLADVDVTAFAKTVTDTLSDPRSWTASGISLQRVDGGPFDFEVALTSPLTVRDLCGYEIPIETSCWDPGDQRVVINLARWVRGAATYLGDIDAYRTYLINHETGHALGHLHAHGCLASGNAPVMLQQTIGLLSVDGRLCQPNAWPYPPGMADAPGVEEPDTDENSEFNLVSD